MEGDTLGGPSQFDYKYVPDTGKKTTYEEDVQRPDDAKNAFSIETVYFWAFLCGVVAFLLAGSLGFKMSMTISRSLIAIVS